MYVVLACPVCVTCILSKAAYAKVLFISRLKLLPLKWRKIILETMCVCVCEGVINLLVIPC